MVCILDCRNNAPRCVANHQSDYSSDSNITLVLKFLPDSFDICTAFFSLKYIPKGKHSKVFEEAHRVLKGSGQFLLWDVRIPRTKKKHRQFIVPLKVQLPDETVETGYGVKWQTQDINHFKELAKEHKFKIVDEWSKGEILHLKMLKES